MNNISPYSIDKQNRKMSQTGYGTYGNSYSNSYGNSYGGAYGAFGTNKTSDSSGGWSKGTSNKGFEDPLQSGGWGKKVEKSVGLGTTAFGANKTGYGTGAFGKSSFGTGAFGTGAFGASSYGTGAFGASSYGTGAFGAKSGFGTSGFGTNLFNKPQQQRVSVPITTMGLSFTSMEKEERVGSNQIKKFVVYHINMIEMFSQYTSEELRYYDYVAKEIIPSAAGAQPLAGTTNFTSAYQSSNISTTQNQQKIISHNVQWWEVPIASSAPAIQSSYLYNANANANNLNKKLWSDKIREIKEAYPDQENLLKQPYSLSDPKFKISTTDTKDAKRDEIKINPPIKLKGFQSSNNTFSSHLESLKSSDSKTIYADSSFEIEDFKIRFQSSMSKSATLNQNSNKSSRKANQSFSLSSANKSQSTKSKEIAPTENKNELTFIPNILKIDEGGKLTYDTDANEMIITNLIISKYKCRLIFPFSIDILKLDPLNNVKITSYKQKEADSIYTRYGVKITIEKKAKIDHSTKSIVFINESSNEHFFIKTGNNNHFERDGTTLSLTFADLEPYPLDIYIRKHEMS